MPMSMRDVLVSPYTRLLVAAVVAAFVAYIWGPDAGRQVLALLTGA